MTPPKEIRDLLKLTTCCGYNKSPLSFAPLAGGRGVDWPIFSLSAILAQAYDSKGSLGFRFSRPPNHR